MNRRKPDAEKRNQARLEPADRRMNGLKGEVVVTKLVRCPNCGSKLMRLPPSFPIYDVQCERCLFRAQVKSASSAPRGEVFGGGLNIHQHLKRAGAVAPPVIANFSWRARGKPQQAIYLFPFLTARNIRARVRSARGPRAGYREFNYVGLLGDNVPKMLLFARGDWQEYEAVRKR